MKRIFVMAALATFATAAHAQNNTAAPATTTNTLTTTPAANGQTSTSVTNSAAAAPKAWSVTFLNELSTDASQLNYLNVHSKTFSALNYVGAGYKLNEKNRIGVRQYFGVDRDGATGSYTTTMMDPVVTYTRSVDSILNAEPSAATFWYYIPTSDASRNANSNGQVRMDYELAYTLTPKWTASYYFNPRQNFIPNGTLVGDDGKETALFAKTTLIHYGILNYNFSDSVSAYTYAGFKHRWQTSSLTLNEESLLTAVGASFSFISGKININPEISSESKRVAGFQKVDGGSAVDEANISYALSSAFSF